MNVRNVCQPFFVFFIVHKLVDEVLSGLLKIGKKAWVNGVVQAYFQKDITDNVTDLIKGGAFFVQGVVILQIDRR